MEDDYRLVTLFAERQGKRNKPLHVVTYLGFPNRLRELTLRCRRYLEDGIDVIEQRLRLPLNYEIGSFLLDIKFKLVCLRENLIHLEKDTDFNLTAPGYQSVLIIFDRFMKGLLKRLNSLPSNTTWFRFLCHHRFPFRTSWAFSIFISRELELDSKKLDGILLIIRHCLHYHVTINKKDRLSPFLAESEEGITDLESIIKEIDMVPFFISLSKHYKTRLRLSYQAIIKVTASATHARHYKNYILRMLAFGFYNTFYLYFSEKAAERCVHYLNETDFASGLFLWNLPETPVLREFIRATYKNVKSYRLLSIPYNEKYGDRSQRLGSFSDLGSKEKKSILNDLEDLDSSLKGIDTEELLIELKPMEAEGMSSKKHSISHSVFDPSNVASTSRAPQQIIDAAERMIAIPPLPIEYIQAKHPVNIRIIYTRALPHSSIVKNTATWFQENYDTVIHVESISDDPITLDQEASLCPSLIIYFHGGGFIAMTSFSHEMYTRKWAIDTDTPMVAVDYKLAPEYTYPVQTEECYLAYRWAIDHSRSLGSSAKKIVLIGDSAGGNLVASLTVRAIVENIRIPDGIILAYPALYLQPSFSFSRLCSILDPMLNLRVLLFIMTIYVKESYNHTEDPFLSPAITPDAILARFPPVRMIVGDMDPLLDDSVYFYRRLKAIHHDVQISVQEGYGHGFLNFVYLMPEIKQMLDLISIWLLQIFHDTNEDHNDGHGVFAAPAPSRSALDPSSH